MMLTKPQILESAKREARRGAPMRKRHHPTNEAELRKVREGELVKLFFSPLGTGVKGSIWARYGGLKEEEDIFTYQSKSISSESPDSVVMRSSPRKTHRYEQEGGVILCHLHELTEYIPPQRREYEERVRELKAAGIWEE